MSTAGSGTFRQRLRNHFDHVELHHGIVAERESISRGIYEHGGDDHDYGSTR